MLAIKQAYAYDPSIESELMAWTTTRSSGQVDLLEQTI